MILLSKETIFDEKCRELMQVISNGDPSKVLVVINYKKLNELFAYEYYCEKMNIPVLDGSRYSRFQALHVSLENVSAVGNTYMFNKPSQDTTISNEIFTEYTIYQMMNYADGATVKMNFIIYNVNDKSEDNSILLNRLNFLFSEECIVDGENISLSEIVKILNTSSTVATYETLEATDSSQATMSNISHDILNESGDEAFDIAA